MTCKQNGSKEEKSEDGPLESISFLAPKRAKTLRGFASVGKKDTGYDYRMTLSVYKN